MVDAGYLLISDRIIIGSGSYWVGLIGSGWVGLLKGLTGLLQVRVISGRVIVRSGQIGSSCNMFGHIESDSYRVGLQTGRSGQFGLE